MKILPRIGETFPSEQNMKNWMIDNGWKVQGMGYGADFKEIVFKKDDKLYVVQFYRPQPPYSTIKITYVKKRKEKWTMVSMKGKKDNPIQSNLYKSFHGVAPIRKRKVYYEAPPKELICIGVLSEIRYKPVRGKHVGTEFYHKSGDTGDKTLKSNLVLATDSEGKNLYLLRRTKSGLPRFTNRGIIG